MRRRWWWGGSRRRDGAAGGRDEAGDDAEEGGFAGAVFAEDDGAGSGGEGGGDVTQGGEGAVELGDGVERCGGRLCFGAGWGCGRHLLFLLVSLHASIGLTPGLDAAWEIGEENEYFETDRWFSFCGAFG